MAAKKCSSDEEIDLLDLLDGTAERIEMQREHDRAIAALRQLWEDRHAARPDGAPMADGEGYCGRCGQNTFHYGLTINHDLGHLGCPADVDPTWSRYECVGFRTAIGYDGPGLTVADLCDRWDRHYFPDCICGHPWGVHCRADYATTDFACRTYCGCQIYREA